MSAAESREARPRLYVTLLSHLDTQWRWTVRETIARFLPATVADNAALLGRHPGLVLSFEGAYRYQLLAEYHPAHFATLRALVRAGRWSPAGSALEAFDANLPSPESIVRQILYGSRWFRRELGVAARDLLLPDCFGFPASLPTLAAHCAIAGFSTQKLSRGDLMRSAYGIPFAVGIWEGSDGSELPAALDPGEYSGRVAGDLANDVGWRTRFAELEARGLPPVLLFYVGLGDKGGAVPEPSPTLLEGSAASAGAIDVRPVASDRLFLELGDDERRRLPRYRGELLLRLHATGCYSAQAAMKRWNRANERLAFAAEAAATAATWLGARPYPRAALEEAWTRMLAHQMHDDLTGTSLPAAYEISWNDEAIAANRFATLLADALGAIAGALDTTGPGEAVVVFHPGASARTAAIEIARRADDEEIVAGAALEVPSQPGFDAEGRPVTIFEAPLPAVGCAVFGRRPRPAGHRATPTANALEASERALANSRYRARFDEAGRLASLFDRRLDRELLSAPLELELLDDRSKKYPAWEIPWEAVSRPPRERFRRVDSIRLLEAGPVRATLEVRRRAAGSTIRELWRLHAGPAGEALEVVVDLDWRTPGTLLKYAFPLAASNAGATYDLGVGVVERPIASERLYEVPAQGWVDLTDASGAFGVSVACDSRQGWDQPAADRLRLTLVHSPRVGRRFRHQARQDFGRHRLTIALAGHAGGWRAGEAWRLAERFDRAPIPFAVPDPRPGPLGRRWSFCDLGAAAAQLLALKTAEASAEIVVRVAERSGAAARRVARFPEPVLAARAVDGQEESASGDPPPWSLRPDGLTATACTLAPPSAGASPPRFAALALPFERRGFSRQDERARPGFDDRGDGFPVESLTGPIEIGGVIFDLAHAGRGPDVAVARGQSIPLAGGFEEVWLLGASIEGELAVDFEVGALRRTAALPGWREKLGAWDRERWTIRGRRRRAGFRKRAAIAALFGHVHDAAGRDRVHEPACLFLVRLAAGATAGALVFPDEPRARFVAAAQVAGAGPEIVPLAPLVLDSGR